MWDGKVKLLNRVKKTIYKGLYEKIADFCSENQYKFVSNLKTSNYPISDEELTEFLEYIIKEKYDRRDYQLEAIKRCITEKRATLLSPTSSGKSMIIYALTRFHEKRTLIIVPTVSLVNQMKSDFFDYVKDDWSVEDHVSIIMAGESKENLKDVTISTWQSIYKLAKTDPEWFEQFDLILCDEVHTAKADAIKSILECSVNCQFRYGFTGTLDGVECNELVIEGLFGPVFKVIATHELIEQGYASEIEIKCLELKYSKLNCQPLRDYQKEIAFITSHEKRLKFIAKLALSLKGNTLVLFRKVETHGKILAEIAEKDKSLDHRIHFISGSVKVGVRDEIRVDMNSRDERNVLFASEGTTSTGVSINNIDNIIFASPTKAKVRVLQSIGRGLRMSETKNKMTLYDICDDLRKPGKSVPNYTYGHYIERLNIYIKEKFPYKIIKVELEK